MSLFCFVLSVSVLAELPKEPIPETQQNCPRKAARPGLQQQCTNLRLRYLETDELRIWRRSGSRRSCTVNQEQGIMAAIMVRDSDFDFTKSGPLSFLTLNAHRSLPQRRRGSQQHPEDSLKPQDPSVVP